MKRYVLVFILLLVIYSQRFRQAQYYVSLSGNYSIIYDDFNNPAEPLVIIDDPGSWNNGSPIYLNSNNWELGKTNIFYFTFPINFYYELIKNKISIGEGLSPSVVMHSKQVFWQNFNQEAPGNSSDGLNNVIYNTNNRS